MTPIIKTFSIETLSEKIGGKLWIKGSMKRIYLDEGYNTKKMSTKTYIFQRQDQSYGINCSIECPSQDEAWVVSQEEEIVSRIASRLGSIIEEFGEEIENPGIAIQATLDTEEQVRGYYMRWHEVRVKINGYGKLAYRKRMKVHTYNGPKSRKPAGFIELNDADYQIALEKELKQTVYEYGCEPNLIGASQPVTQ